MKKSLVFGLLILILLLAAGGCFYYMKTDYRMTMNGLESRLTVNAHQPTQLFAAA